VVVVVVAAAAAVMIMIACIKDKPVSHAICNAPERVCIFVV
jgi:hypothetical protein